jgi:hypothetical protein
LEIVAVNDPELKTFFTACRAAVKTGKVCAIKTGMGLEDGNMQ